MSMRTDAMDQQHESTRPRPERKSGRAHVKAYLRTVRTMDEIDEPANAGSIFSGLIEGAL